MHMNLFLKTIILFKIKVSNIDFNHLNIFEEDKVKIFFFLKYSSQNIHFWFD
jgi:hypothetical protein